MRAFKKLMLLVSSLDERWFYSPCLGAGMPETTYRNMFLIQTILEKGFDIIACIAVNDAWVMDAWARAAGAIGKVTMLADGSAHYVKALGLESDLSGVGMGVPGRVSMVVERGIVESIHIDDRMMKRHLPFIPVDYKLADVGHGFGACLPWRVVPPTPYDCSPKTDTVTPRGRESVSLKVPEG